MTEYLTQPRLQWVTAAPLWQRTTGDHPVVAMRQPAVLRFETDRFMDELLETLQGGRAAELTNIPNTVLIELYEKLRPYRSSYYQLLAASQEIAAIYDAPETGAYIRHAAETYRATGLLRQEVAT